MFKRAFMINIIKEEPTNRQSGVVLLLQFERGKRLPARLPEMRAFGQEAIGTVRC